MYIEYPCWDIFCLPLAANQPNLLGQYSIKLRWLPEMVFHWNDDLIWWYSILTWKCFPSIFGQLLAISFERLKEWDQLGIDFDGVSWDFFFYIYCLQAKLQQVTHASLIETKSTNYQHNLLTPEQINFETILVPRAYTGNGNHLQDNLQGKFLTLTQLELPTGNIFCQEDDC